MAKRNPASPEELAMLQKRLKAAKSTGEHRLAQCVWLHRKQGMGAPAIAQAVGLSRSHAYAVLAEYRRHGEAALDLQARGGRYHVNLPLAEEAELLEALKAKAAKGGVLVVSEVQKAYEKRLGRTVPSSTVYFMLHRHGWRKLQPRGRHREADPAAPEAFKKSWGKRSKRPSASRHGWVGPSA
jgi:transposase